MNKCFKKYALLFVASVVMCSVACKKDNKSDDPGGGGGGTGLVIEAKDVIDSDDKIAIVEAYCFEYYSADWSTIAKGKYENDGFKLTLSGTLNSKYLYGIIEELDEWAIISHPNAKIGGVSGFAALDRDNNEIGEFYCFGETDNGWIGILYLYADRDFTLKGSYTYEDDDWYEVETYDCAFKKGWNAMYSIEEYYDEGDVFILTTKKPSGVIFEWYYYDDWWEYDRKMSATGLRDKLSGKMPHPAKR